MLRCKSAAGSRKVVCGGSWRTAFRKPDDADYRGISIGFCQVRTVD